MLGRAIAAVGFVAWLVGVRLGWDELLLVAGGCLIVLVAALIMTIGRADLEVIVELAPPRITVGEEAVGRVGVRNRGARRMLPVRLEVPVGKGVAGFAVPSLPQGGTWDEPFVIPADRRGVIPVGPVSSVRGDPLGLARRTVQWADAVQLFIHPRIVRLTGLVAGWLRDLEGRPTNELSPSDVAFHTLREYVPGDDRRHVHWRTSARLGTLMVRQFVDTRRTHLGLILSTSPGHYASDEELELAVSAIGSLGVAALVEDQTVAVSTGLDVVRAHDATRLLDGLAGVELAEEDTELVKVVRRASRAVQGASVVAVVTGSTVSPAVLRSAADVLQGDVRVLAVRIVVGAPLAVQTIGSTTVLELGDLADLVRLLQVTASR